MFSAKVCLLALSLAPCAYAQTCDALDTDLCEPDFSSSSFCSGNDTDLCDPDATTISHSVTFSSLANAAAYTGTVKTTYEVGYGLGLGIYDQSSESYAFGCSVSSTAARRAATVAFTGSVHHTLATSALSAASSMSASSLVSNIATANTVLGAGITVPTASQITSLTQNTVNTPTSSPTSNNDDKLSTGWLIALICIGALLALALAGIAIYFATKSAPAPAPEPELPDEKTVELEPGVEIAAYPIDTGCSQRVCC